MFIDAALRTVWCFIPMLKIARVLLLAAVSAVGATAASAGTVTLSPKNPSDIFDGGGRSSVWGISNRSGLTANAGGFRVVETAPGQPGQQIIAWCLDILHNLSLPSSYQITPTPFNGAVLGATQIANIDKLFELNFKNVDLSNNAASAGFQIALWELVYETGSSFNASSGSWFLQSSTAALAAANTYLGKLASYISDPNSVPILQSYDLKFYESQNGQDLVSVTAVPLPAAVWLLGAGVAGLVAVGRRKASARKAAVA